MHNSYSQYCRPKLGDFLSSIGLDKSFSRAEGAFLYETDSSGKERAFIDWVGGYGAGLLGHHHPELLEVVTSFFEARRPVQAQLSIRTESGHLAYKLEQLFYQHTQRSYLATFSNSGAEAVEAAIKHALMEYQTKLNRFWNTFELSRTTTSQQKFANPVRWMGHLYDQKQAFFEAIRSHNQEVLARESPFILALEHAFHGKTTGALQLTHREEFREPFLGKDPVRRFIPVNSEALQNALDQSRVDLILPQCSWSGEWTLKKIPFHRIAGIIAEPIQGEGGVKPIDHFFLRQMRESCTLHDIPLIFDEIQCGCWRTGNFLASTASGVIADYYLLGKSLGGGLAKIAATMIHKDRYQEDFALLHTSTFAEDDYSALLAQKALEIAASQAHHISQRGQDLLDMLRQLQEVFPSVIKAVRGKGFLIGLEFHDYHLSGNYGFQALSRSGYFGYVLSAYLLNQHQQRCAATLSNPFTLRLQPSIAHGSVEVNALKHSLYDLCHCLERRDLLQLLTHLPYLPAPDPSAPSYIRPDIPQSFPNSRTPLPRVGFLTHYIDLENLRASEPSLRNIDDEAAEKLIDLLENIWSPILLGEQMIQSANGSIELVFMGLGFTSKTARDARLSGKEDLYTALCQEAINFLERKYQPDIIGLGQHTSIIGKNGRAFYTQKAGLTSGNSLTVFMGLEAIRHHFEMKSLRLEHCRVGIVGAAGNIGKTYADLLSGHCRELVLFGSEGSTGLQGAQRTARQLKQAGKEAIAKNNTLNFKRFDLLIVATSSPHYFLHTDNVDPETLICDLSVPGNCSPELCHRNSVIAGGVVQLPGGETLLPAGFPLGPQEAFACITETIILGLTRHVGHYSYGAICPEQVEQMGRLAEEWGFQLAREKMVH